MNSINQVLSFLGKREKREREKKSIKATIAIEKTAQQHKSSFILGIRLNSIFFLIIIE